MTILRVVNFKSDNAIALAVLLTPFLLTEN